jgi:hypothetical protein
MFSRRSFLAGSGIACLGLAILVSGCGGEFTVSGKIKTKGQPLNGGIVKFIGSGVERSASINADGSYTIFNPPKGEVIVVVDVKPIEMPDVDTTERPQGVKLPDKGQRPPQPVLVDARYADAATSPIRKTVKHSGQKINIDLDD